MGRRVAHPCHVAAGQIGRVEPLWVMWHFSENVWLEMHKDRLTCYSCLWFGVNSFQGFYSVPQTSASSRSGPRSGPGSLCILSTAITAVLTDLCVLVLCLCSQSAAPFLHILALASVTAGSWFVAGYSIGRQRPSKSWKLFVMLVHHLLWAASSAPAFLNIFASELLSAFYVLNISLVCACGSGL